MLDAREVRVSFLFGAAIGVFGGQINSALAAGTALLALEDDLLALDDGLLALDDDLLALGAPLLAHYGALVGHEHPLLVELGDLLVAQVALHALPCRWLAEEVLQEADNDVLLPLKRTRRRVK